MAGRIPSRGSDQFVVRFPDGMRDQIASAAEANGRSMNAEIVSRLEQFFTLKTGLSAESDVVKDAVKEAFKEMFPENWRRRMREVRDGASLEKNDKGRPIIKRPKS